MKDQRVTTGSPTKNPSVGGSDARQRGAKNRSAVPGVGARNGAKKLGPQRCRDGRDHKQSRPAIASRLVALIDRHGMVCAVFSRPAEAKAFLMGGQA